MTKYDTQGAFDKLGQDPFLPPAPAPRKSRKGWVIAGLVVAAIGVGGAMSETENPTSSISTPVDTVQVDELVSYDGVPVSTMVTLTEGLPETARACDLISVVGWDTSRQMYLDAEPQLGSDAYEGAVFDQVFAGC